MTFADFFHMTFTFWVVLDAVGSIPIYLALTSHLEPARQRFVIMREMLIALALLMFFLFFGDRFFNFLHIDTPSLQIAGGAILFLIGLRLLFSQNAIKKERTVKEPLIVPLAIPTIAGPGIIATISLYAGLEHHTGYLLLSLFVAWALSLPFLLLGSFLKRLFGDNGLIAIERLFGYLITLLAIDMGLKGFVTTFT